MPVTFYTYFATNTNADYRLKYDNKTYERGKIHDFSKAKLGVNVPVYRGKFYNFSLAGHYGYYHQNFNPTTPYTGKYRMDMNGDQHTWQMATNGVFYGRLFGKMLVSNLHFSVDGSNHGFEKFSGRVVAMLQMKRTETTSWGIGVLGLINSTVPFPFFPFVTYSNQLSKEWSLNLALPKIHLRYSFDKSHYISLGMSIDNDYFYLHNDNDNLPKTSVYSKLFLNPGITYERPLGRDFCFTVSSGASFLISGRVYDKKHPKDYIRISQPGTAFFNVGVSYNLPKFLR